MKQGIHEVSSEKLYPVGFRYTKDDWVFRYCYAGSDIAIPQRGVANASPHLEGDCIGNAVAGAFTLDLPLTCADFEAVSPFPYTTKDIYKGGYLWIMGADGNPALSEFHRIKGNDAATATYVRVYLETPIRTSQATPWITAYRNIYANCQQDYPDIPTNKQAIVCMTACGLVVPNGSYFWGQTWGPTWTTYYGPKTDLPGLKDRVRELVFSQGGVIATLKDFPTASDYYNQRAGYVLTNTVNTGDMMFMLQLAP